MDSIFKQCRIRGDSNKDAMPELFNHEIIISPHLLARSSRTEALIGRARLDKVPAAGDDAQIEGRGSLQIRLAL